MTTNLSARGQIVIPQELRELDNLKQHDDFTIRRIGPGRYLFEKITRAKGKAKVVQVKGEAPVIVTPKDSPMMTDEMVRAAVNDMFS